MTPFNLFNLVSHVILGLAGIACSYAYLTNLNRRPLKLDFLKRVSVIASIFYILSWLAGGYYYLYHYGPAVRAGIKAARFAWAHAVFTESKEHVFLFLPVLAIVTVVVTFGMEERLEQNEALRRSVTLLAGITVAIGVAVTLSGVAISGAVR